MLVHLTTVRLEVEAPTVTYPKLLRLTTSRQATASGDDKNGRLPAYR